MNWIAAGILALSCLLIICVQIIVDKREQKDLDLFRREQKEHNHG